ncbi:uncharacterized protein [Antedon mediterranea]|uniref:uncharacterized protein n=1 Tax=Antedon mediterranea TaxID=105859 RepID=UPI003AF94158
MANLNQPEPLNISTGNISENWKRFKQRFELYNNNIASGMSRKPSETQTSLLLHTIGQQGLDVYNAFKLKMKMRLNTVMHKFEEYCNPKKNITFERHTFFSRNQIPGEKIDQYVTDLKNKSKTCEFGEIEESLIRDRIVCGLLDNQLRERLLREDDLNLDKCMKICKASEASRNLGKELKADHQVAVDQLGMSNNYKHDRTKDRDKSKPCSRCTRSHEYGKCPAFGMSCNNCGRKNHFSRACRSKRNDKQKGKYINAPNRSKRNVHGINKSNGSDCDSEDESNITFEAIKISQINAKDGDTEVFTNVKIEINRNKPTFLKVKVDTGAEGNILPLRMYRAMFPKNMSNNVPNDKYVNKSNVKVTAYNGAQIKHYGYIHIPCYFNNLHTNAKFYIAEVQGPAIMGLPTLKTLKIIQINCAVEVNDKIKDVEDIKRLYPDRFEGIGKFEGTYKIVIDETVPPVIHAPRSCPLAIKNDIKAELDEMMRLNVIQKVEKPVDWVSSLAYSQKPNGRWRICLDPKDLNKAIKRTYHHTPTLDEITHKFSGAKFFSKLDARHGYWSIRLDKESSYLTTFNTPGFGRFRFLRLPFGLNVSQDVFQHKMDQILEKCIGATGIADDVAVFGKTEEEHDRNLMDLMETAREYGLVFNAEKCEIKRP